MRFDFCHSYIRQLSVYKDFARHKIWSCELQEISCQNGKIEPQAGQRHSPQRPFRSLLRGLASPRVPI